MNERERERRVRKRKQRRHWRACRRARILGAYIGIYTQSHAMYAVTSMHASSHEGCHSAIRWTLRLRYPHLCPPRHLFDRPFLFCLLQRGRVAESQRPGGGPTKQWWMGSRMWRVPQILSLGGGSLDRRENAHPYSSCSVRSMLLISYYGGGGGGVGGGRRV